MAKDNNKGNAAQNSADAILEALLKQSGAAELHLDRCLYSAEKCGDVPVVGYLIDLMDMPPIDMGKDGKRDWQAFLVLLTHPCKGVDREDNVIDLKAGEEVVVPATFQIQQALRRFAADPRNMHELGIAPKAKIDIGGGKNFWQYRVVATGKTKERGALYALPGAEVPADAAKALPAGNTVPAAGQAATPAAVPAS